MEYYKHKDQMRNWLESSVVHYLKNNPDKEISLAKLCADVQKKWYTVSDLAVKKQLLRMCDLDESLVFEERKNAKTGRSVWWLRYEQ